MTGSDNGDLPVDTIAPRLINAIAKALSLEANDIDGEAGIGRTERWDSFGHFRVILDIEAAFDVRFTMDQIATLGTAKSIQEELKRRGTL